MRFVPTKLRLIKQRKRDDPPAFFVQDLWGSKAIQTAFQAINSLYTQFIGTQHFKCMTKYLGYQGIALIMSEFFKFIEISVRNLEIVLEYVDVFVLLNIDFKKFYKLQNNLAEYVRIMYKKLKKNINIPRYEYGSSAIMTFYNESLANLISYGELRTNVFHQFAQIGNAIVFSMLLEQTLVSEKFCINIIVF